MSEKIKLKKIYFLIRTNKQELRREALEVIIYFFSRCENGIKRILFSLLKQKRSLASIKFITKKGKAKEDKDLC